MTWRYALVTMLLVFVYIQVFLTHEQHKKAQEVTLSPALPTVVLKVLSHTYMQQMAAEILFIKAAVFYGGGGDELKGDNRDVMTNHFLAMTELHPEIEDIYYRTESALSDKGDAYVRITNQILESGREAIPELVTLPYFEGFNYYYYLDEPLKGAELLRLASTYDKKYTWLGHLASTLEAKGGNIRAGLTWLKGMHASMQDSEEKERYAKDIQDYELAMIVQTAIETFNKKYGRYPETLDGLIPEFLNSIPKVSVKFDLVYEQPLLFLRVKGKR